jgi:glycosyltransferase involved in cell wall biosynthesis
MHLIDTLDAGGAERMCVQLANALPRDRYQPHVCATRRGGPLREEIASDVGFLELRRASRFDVPALFRLRAYLRTNGIRLLHAHGTSVFMAVAARFLTPGRTVVWHDHYGGHDEKRRPSAVYRALRVGLGAVIAVNEKLRAWSVEQVGMPEARVRFVPNFASQQPLNFRGELPGEGGYRIAHVANLRPQKDHPTMLRAMRRIVDTEARAHLLLVGHAGDDDYTKLIRDQIESHGLGRNVSLMGARDDVASILRHCDIGVLSSASEGLPLALLEYGEAGLAVVCTAVGECPAVLEPVAEECLVPAGDDRAIADAVLSFLRSREKRHAAGEKILSVVRRSYSEEAAIRTVMEVYDQVLA